MYPYACELRTCWRMHADPQARMHPGHAHTCTSWRRTIAGGQVFGVVWNNFKKERDSEGKESIEPYMFVTYGVKHLKFWRREPDTTVGLGAAWLGEVARPPRRLLELGARAAVQACGLHAVVVPMSPCACHFLSEAR